MATRTRAGRKVSAKTPTRKPARNVSKPDTPETTPRVSHFRAMCLAQQGLERIRSQNGRNSSLPCSFTPEERHAWIQNYVNSIESDTLKRIDFIKPPVDDIITKLPDISFDDEDKTFQNLLSKIKKQSAIGIVSCFDYNKEVAGPSCSATTTVPVNGDRPEASKDEQTDVTLSYDEFCARPLESISSPRQSAMLPPSNEAERNEISLAETKDGPASSPRTPTSEETIVYSPDCLAHNVNKLVDEFVTRRTPARNVRPQLTSDEDDEVVEVPLQQVECSVVVIEDSDNENDQSVQVIQERSPSPRCTRQQKRNKKRTQPAENLRSKRQCGGPSKLSAVLGECPICMEPFDTKQLSATVCGHIFCTPCLKSALQSKKVCPMCRKHVNMKKVHPLYL